MRALLIPAVIVWAMFAMVIGMIYFVRMRSAVSSVQRITGYRNVLALLLAGLICIAASLAFLALSGR